MIKVFEISAIEIILKYLAVAMDVSPDICCDIVRLWERSVPHRFSTAETSKRLFDIQKKTRPWIANGLAVDELFQSNNETVWFCIYLSVKF